MYKITRYMQQGAAGPGLETAQPFWKRKVDILTMKKWMMVCAALMLALLCAGALAEETAAAGIAANVGDIVTFGHYEQDNDESNGKEPIEWIVLDVQDGKALLLTRYAIDAHNYHSGQRETSFPTWEKSEIRAWLNSEFLAAAFDDEEAASIATVTLSNPSYKKYNWGGPDTEDRVFLLSRDEVEQYFPTYESRMVIPTAYAHARGAWESSTYDIDGVKTTWWWLRTPGYYRSCAASVRTRGTITSNRVYDESGALRPAIWLTL